MNCIIIYSKNGFRQDLTEANLQRRRELGIILHVWKIHNNQYPNNIDLKFKLNLRLNAVKAIIKPLPKKVKGKVLTTYDQRFAVRGAKLWNSLHADLTHISSFLVFKTALFNYIKTVPDRPPLPGYPYQSSNSLLDLSTFCD